MNIIVETIEFFQKLTRERIVTIDERKYLDNGNDLNPITDPAHPLLRVDLSLTGLVDYINQNPDGITMEKWIVIDDYRNVSLVSAPYGDFKQRDLLASAGHSSFYNFEDSNGGNLRGSAESLIITLQSCFKENDGRKYLTDLISNIKVDDEQRIEDDGISQKVAVKKGITTIKQETVQPYVTLQPCITFPEIEQPEIVYYIRLNQDPNNIVNVRLFPHQDFSWKTGCAERIAEYLTLNIQETIQIIR